MLLSKTNISNIQVVKCIRNAKMNTTSEIIEATCVCCVRDCLLPTIILVLLFNFSLASLNFVFVNFNIMCSIISYIFQLCLNDVLYNTSGKELTCQCRRCKRCGFGPWIGKIPQRTWQPTSILGLENPMDRGTQQATVHRVTKSHTEVTQHEGMHMHSSEAFLNTVSKSYLVTCILFGIYSFDNIHFLIH